jgi:hypothetical protein
VIACAVVALGLIRIHHPLLAACDSPCDDLGDDLGDDVGDDPGAWDGD